MSPLPKWYILVDFAYIATGSAVSIKLDVGVNGRSPLPLNKQFWQNTDLDPPNRMRVALRMQYARSTAVGRGAEGLSELAEGQR